ncbi:MAG TPA: hypothetical protein VFI31_30590 [Pirellulales bacterium]|nr:hypothetical protein [Pirellulales bacterium]
MKPWSVILVAMLSLVAGWVVYAQAPKGRTSSGKPPAKIDAAPNDAAPFMRLKLEHSQKLLEGVVLEDFPAIKQHAQKLAALSLDENWQILQTREYRDYTQDFQQIASRLSKAADEKNLDGAALGYVQMTLVCVNCHKHVRDGRQ